MRRVVWQSRALADFDAQIAFIAEASPANAMLVADRIDAVVSLLRENPVGRTGRVPGTFEFVVPKTAYIVAYALSDDGHALHVLRVIHAARHWPIDGFPE
jgi:toxin ParE1/3/4